ncbi:hypothetical protein [Sorangium sp. So ce1335]|uniref:hypothetical protein n=1 Tax=Sorangium sp. So ce1335 TaxID=3133335 RepID=UPI003F638CCF
MFVDEKPHVLVCAIRRGTHGWLIADVVARSRLYKRGTAIAWWQIRVVHRLSSTARGASDARVAVAARGPARRATRAAR